MAVLNGLKHTITASGGLGLLQIVSELVIGQCVNEKVGLPRGVDCEIPHQLRDDETFLIRVWKPLPRAITNSIIASHRAVCQRESWASKGGGL